MDSYTNFRAPPKAAYFLCVVPCVSFCTGHFVMVPLNMTYLHCLQHSLFEHLFNVYYHKQEVCFLLYCLGQIVSRQYNANQLD